MEDQARTASIYSNFAQTFLEQVCIDPYSADRLLTMLYPSGAQCASCGAIITGRRALASFWRGERTYCSSCDSKFSPWSGTILDNTKLDPPQIEKMLLGFSLGLDHKQIAVISGVTPDTVNMWAAKIKFWESHA